MQPLNCNYRNICRSSHFIFKNRLNTGREIALSPLSVYSNLKHRQGQKVCCLITDLNKPKLHVLQTGQSPFKHCLLYWLNKMRHFLENDGDSFHCTQNWIVSRFKSSGWNATTRLQRHLKVDLQCLFNSSSHEIAFLCSYSTSTTYGMR